MKQNWPLIFVFLAAVYFFYFRKPASSPLEAKGPREEMSVAPARAAPATAKIREPKGPAMAFTPAPARRLQELPKGELRQRKDVIPYVLDEGLAVVQGDLVVGVPAEENPEHSGLVLMPKVDLWNSNVIPFFIQPNVKNPERVYEALEMFSGTAVQFVPYTHEEDVLVFEDSTGICKSYVGRIGGKQPIWIPAGCEATEVAHEIMHALGFVHEQNRSDRDQFIQVMADNIKEEFRENFDLLPPDMMKLTGLESFDFDSIMIYPPTMFAKSNQPTMVARTSQQEINPSNSLSAKDRARLNRAFGP